MGTSGEGYSEGENFIQKSMGSPRSGPKHGHIKPVGFPGKDPGTKWISYYFHGELLLPKFIFLPQPLRNILNTSLLLWVWSSIHPWGGFWGCQRMLHHPSAIDVDRTLEWILECRYNSEIIIASWCIKNIPFFAHIWLLYCKNKVQNYILNKKGAIEFLDTEEKAWRSLPLLGHLIVVGVGVVILKRGIKGNCLLLLLNGSTGAGLPPHSQMAALHVHYLLSGMASTASLFLIMNQH